MKYLNFIIYKLFCCVGGGEVFETDEFDGSRSFTLTAELSGGNGDNAWQHAQLFRQEMSDTNSYPLKISVKLRPS